MAYNGRQRKTDAQRETQNIDRERETETDREIQNRKTESHTERKTQRHNCTAGEAKHKRDKERERNGCIGKDAKHYEERDIETDAAAERYTCTLRRADQEKIDPSSIMVYDSSARLFMPRAIYAVTRRVLLEL